MKSPLKHIDNIIAKVQFSSCSVHYSIVRLNIEKHIERFHFERVMRKVYRLK